MNILYLDESGGPNSWNIQKNFVLGGVAVHEGQIYSLTKQMNDLQEKYFPGITVPIEFHISLIKRGKGPHFNQFSEDEREEIIADVFMILEKQHFPNTLAFATSIDISAVVDQHQVSQSCFEDVCQHFNLFCYNRHKQGNLTKRMLIIDRGREKQYLQHFSEFRKSKRVEKYLANIVDIPYFAACSETRMLQLADFVANAVWQYYERGVTREIDKIKHIFYRGPKYYPVSGLNHITKDTCCNCFACNFKKVMDPIT